MLSESQRGKTQNATGKDTPPRSRWRRPPLLLYSYIANELLAPFFASFLILYCVFFLVRLIPLLEVVLALRIGIGDFIRLFSYIFPHMLLYIIPMASMAGVIVGFTRLTNDREILALKACGVSLKQMLPPVIVIAASIACLTGYFSIQLIPTGAVSVKQLMFQLAKEKIDKGLKAKEFTETLGDIVIYVDSIDDQQRWHGVYVSDLRGRQQPLITVAKSGHMEAEMERMLVTIILNDGTLHNNEGQDNQVIRFSRYQLQISLRPPTQIGKEDVTSLGRGAMSQQQLLEAAARQPPGSKEEKIFLSAYHQRLLLPVGCFILSLIGLPLGLQAGPGKRAVGIPLGLACFVLYYITLTTTRMMSEEGVLPLALGMWLPNILFFILAVYLLRRVHQERPLVPVRVQNLALQIYDRFLKSSCERVARLIHKVVDRWILRRPVAGDEADQCSVALTIHADSTTGLFHLPDCPEYNCPHCRIKFKSIRIAREAGFTPCPLCAALMEQDQNSTD
jgi:lipopolysaccharide export system permease protein